MKTGGYRAPTGVSFDLRSIARALGGEVSGRQVLAPGPGHSPRDRSLAICLSQDAPDGILVHSYAGDDWRICREHVLLRLGVPAWEPGDERQKQRTTKPVQIPPRAVICKRDTDGSSGYALRLWREAAPISNSIGVTYFRRERNILELPPNVHDVLRFHRRCPFGHDTSGRPILHPCIIVLFRDVLTNTPTGIHRIALDAQGRLVGRMALGRKQGSAVKLWNDADVATGLVVGEGIESTLAAAMIEHRHTMLRPAWSLVDAGNLENFPVLPTIEHLTIVADNDGSNRGQGAARACAKRWAAAGRTVEVLVPDEIGDDFNDIIKDVRWSA